MATSQVEWDSALMAPLKNPRHEAFVHSYLKCGDAFGLSADTSTVRHKFFVRL